MPAAYEVAYQLHERFVGKGGRDAIAMTMVIPAARPVPNPDVATALERLLEERGIELVAGTPIGAIDAAARRVVVGARTVDYDLFIGVPVHVPPPVVAASALGKGFVEVSPLTLETRLPDVYAIGDVAKIPVGDSAVPKAGAFAEDAARTVVSAIAVKEGRAAAVEKFRAKGACYFDIGDGRVAKIDANYLGGDRPRMVLEGPSAELHVDKASFESTRRDRWFNG